MLQACSEKISEKIPEKIQKKFQTKLDLYILSHCCYIVATLSYIVVNSTVVYTVATMLQQWKV